MQACEVLANNTFFFIFKFNFNYFIKKFNFNLFYDCV